jgi:hypothetical protein
MMTREEYEAMFKAALGSQGGNKRRPRNVSVARKDFVRTAEWNNAYIRRLNLSEEQIATLVASSCLKFGKISKQREMTREDNQEKFMAGFNPHVHIASHFTGGKDQRQNPVGDRLTNDVVLAKCDEDLRPHLTKLLAETVPGDVIAMADGYQEDVV